MLYNVFYAQARAHDFPENGILSPSPKTHTHTVVAYIKIFSRWRRADKKNRTICCEKPRHRAWIQGGAKGTCILRIKTYIFNIFSKNR